MLQRDTFISKVQGCWMGKSIGGTLGAPLEGANCDTFDRFYDFYLQDLKGKAIPNDDLDLQLVWLNAVEKYGLQLNSRILAEYWISYIFPSWSEYGGGKANLRMGMEPPLSGTVHNMHRESCGAFIRSEIWACIAPGHPEIAARFAQMDAEIDHAGDGVYGEIFCAALESAAFIESDREKLIEIAESYIPEGCGVRRAVESVKDSYKKRLTWKQAFYELMKVEPSSFSWGRHGWTDEQGSHIPTREPGYDAPGNIGIFVIGWFYGEGDFDRSLTITLNCGEDADCTVATMGSVYGILFGIENIPEKWIAPISTEIITCCINSSDRTISVPKTVEEMTERIAFLVPQILGREYYSLEGNEIRPAEDLYYTGKKDRLSYRIDDALERSPYQVRYDTQLFDALLDYRENPFFENGTEKTFSIRFLSNCGNQIWAKLHFFTPEGVSVVGGSERSVYLYQLYHATVETEFTVQIGDYGGSTLEIVCEITLEGRCQKFFLPITLLRDSGAVSVRKDY